MIKAVWLTVNRRCNFRCLWCYAEGTAYSKDSDMTRETALRLINIGLDVGVKDFILLGGEPTFWPHLNDTCKYLVEHEAEATIVTNGWHYANLDLARKARDTGAKISISLKAGSPDQYRQLTKVNAYAKAIQAISNFAQLGSPASISITANAMVMDNLEELVKAATDSGASNIIVEFCSVTFDADGKPQQGYMLPPQEMADRIVAKYDSLAEYSNGNLGIMQIIPFCLYPDDFIEKLVSRSHLMSGCHVVSRSGLVFTHDGGVLLCNCLHGFELGKLGADFHDTKTFNQFWQRKEVISANERLVCYPHRRCMDCSKYDECCGGCPLQWFVFNPETILQEKQNEDLGNEDHDEKENGHWSYAGASASGSP